MPQLLRIGLSDYRRNRKTPTTVATLFGKVSLRRFIYQAVEAGEAGIFPLQIALGITAGRATPALADVVGRLLADLPQQHVLAVLRERYGVCWSVGTLRKVAGSLAEALAPLRQEAQVHYLVGLLDQAANATKRGRPSLVVGRDGVMIPMRCAWEEASTASLTVYDSTGKRWGTTYLGYMPEAGQETMTQHLTRLLTAVLATWEGPAPRLHYVTDAGHHPQEYFHSVLRDAAPDDERPSPLELVGGFLSCRRTDHHFSGKPVWIDRRRSRLGGDAAHTPEDQTQRCSPRDPGGACGAAPPRPET